MAHGKIRRILMGIGIAFIVIALFGGISYARERTDLPQHYPDEYSGQGYIDRIATDEIVINDTWYELSPYVIFNTPHGMNISRSHFRAGQSVYYILNATSAQANPCTTS